MILPSLNDDMALEWLADGADLGASGQTEMGVRELAGLNGIDLPFRGNDRMLMEIFWNNLLSWVPVSYVDYVLGDVDVFWNDVNFRTDAAGFISISANAFPGNNLPPGGQVSGILLPENFPAEGTTFNISDISVLLAVEFYDNSLNWFYNDGGVSARVGVELLQPGVGGVAFVYLEAVGGLASAAFRIGFEGLDDQVAAITLTLGSNVDRVSVGINSSREVFVWHRVDGVWVSSGKVGVIPEEYGNEFAWAGKMALVNGSESDVSVWDKGLGVILVRKAADFSCPGYPVGTVDIGGALVGS